MQLTYFINHGGGPCFFLDPGPMRDAWNAVTDGATRDASLTSWEQAPGARQAQPHEDHLLPLTVAAGAASGELGQIAFQGHALGKPISGFRFG